MSFDRLNIFIAAQWLTAHVSVPSDRTCQSLDRTRTHLEFSCEQRGSREGFYRLDMFDHQ
jgi:hypothetical protein